MEVSKARCCMRAGCFDCNKTTQYIRTTPVLTPFYHPVITSQDISNNVPAPAKNYIPYTLFAFRTKFERMLYHYDPTYHFSFVSKEIDGVMRLTIELYKGAEFVALDEQKASVIQNYVDQSVKTYPAHCLVLDASVGITRGTKTLTKAWVSAIIPFIDFEDRFHVIVDDGKIYLSFYRDPQYVERYGKLYEQIMDTLFEFYERGTIPLSRRFHSNIINEWKMNIVYGQRHDPGAGALKLYEPLWRNQHFAPNPIDFLYERIRGEKNLRIYVGDNFVRRHYVAVALTKIAKKIGRAHV